MPTIKKNQAGISLFIVMVIVLLTAILVAMGFKSAQFNETVTGNTAEYQRTYEAAQALVHDAELDIMYASAKGSTCSGVNCRTYGSKIVDKDNGAGGNIYFPLTDDLTDVMAELRFSSQPCIAGICRPLLDAGKPYAFWDVPADIATLKNRAAHYGQFTGGTYGTSSEKSNPRLSKDNSWYWVEILPYDVSSGFFAGTELAPPANMNVIYRITALVEGPRNTKSVIQKIVIRKTASSS